MKPDTETAVSQLESRVLAKGDDGRAFRAWAATMLGELAPVGPLERALAESIVSSLWSAQRLERAEAELLSKGEDARTVGAAFYQRSAQHRRLVQARESLMRSATRDAAALRKLQRERT
jgi:hypothetical protein